MYAKYIITLVCLPPFHTHTHTQKAQQWFSLGIYCSDQWHFFNPKKEFIFGFKRNDRNIMWKVTTETSILSFKSGLRVSIQFQYLMFSGFNPKTWNYVTIKTIKICSCRHNKSSKQGNRVNFQNISTLNIPQIVDTVHCVFLRVAIKIVKLFISMGLGVRTSHFLSQMCLISLYHPKLTHPCSYETLHLDCTL